MFLYPIPKCTRSPEPRFRVENVRGGGTDKRAHVPAGHHNVPAAVGGGGLAAGITVAAKKCIFKHFQKNENFNFNFILKSFFREAMPGDIGTYIVGIGGSCWELPVSGSKR